MSTVWTVLERFGYTGLQGELEGHKIHRLDNIMTLETGLHGLMDRMSLWFEEVPGQVSCASCCLRPR